MQWSWCCPPYSREEDQGTGEISICSLPLPVLILKENPYFTRNYLHRSESSQTVKTSLHESMCYKKWGILCFWRERELLVKETSEREAELHPSPQSHPPSCHRGTGWNSDLCYSLMKIHFPPMLLLTACQERLLDTIPKACAHWPVPRESNESLFPPQPGPTQGEAGWWLDKTRIILSRKLHF